MVKAHVVTSFAIPANDAVGANRTADAIVAQRDYAARLAATVPAIGGRCDLLGGGGVQHELARQIFPLGTPINDFGGRS